MWKVQYPSISPPYPRINITYLFFLKILYIHSSYSKIYIPRVIKTESSWKIALKVWKKTHMVYNIYIFSRTLRRARPLAWLFRCRILSSLSGFSWIGSMAEKYSYSCLVQWPAVRTCSQIWPVGEWPRIYITWLSLIFVDRI